MSALGSSNDQLVVTLTENYRQLCESHSELLGLRTEADQQWMRLLTLLRLVESNPDHLFRRILDRKNEGRNEALRARAIGVAMGLEARLWRTSALFGQLYEDTIVHHTKRSEILVPGIVAWDEFKLPRVTWHFMRDLVACSYSALIQQCMIQQKDYVRLAHKLSHCRYMAQAVIGQLPEAEVKKEFLACEVLRPYIWEPGEGMTYKPKPDQLVMTLDMEWTRPGAPSWYNLEALSYLKEAVLPPRPESTQIWKTLLQTAISGNANHQSLLPFILVWQESYFAHPVYRGCASWSLWDIGKLIDILIDKKLFTLKDQLVASVERHFEVYAAHSRLDQNEMSLKKLMEHLPEDSKLRQKLEERLRLVAMSASYNKGDAVMVFHHQCKRVFAELGLIYE